MDNPLDRADVVLLDVDGTLVDSHYWHVLAWQRAFAAMPRLLRFIESRLHAAGSELAAAVQPAPVTPVEANENKPAARKAASRKGA